MESKSNSKKVVVLKQPVKKEKMTYDKTFFSCGCFGGGTVTKD